MSRVHLYYPGNDRGECADDGKKLGQEDRGLSISIIKLLSPDEVFLFEYPGIFSLKQQWTGFLSKPITNYVTQHRRHDNKYDNDQPLVNGNYLMFAQVLIKQLIGEFIHIHACSE